MTVIRLKCEARGGGLPIAAPERLKTRKMTPASGRDGAFRADKTRERLARCLAAQVRRSTTARRARVGRGLGPRGDGNPRQGHRRKRQPSSSVVCGFESRRHVFRVADARPSARTAPCER